jgi:cell division protein FtsB
MDRLAWLARRYLPPLLLAGAVVSVPALMLGETGLPRLRALEAERARIEEQISRHSAAIRTLRAEVQALKDDPAELERVARDQLGLVWQTELVFQFSD